MNDDGSIIKQASEFHSTRVAVTGSGGFLGGHLIPRLRTLGVDMIEIRNRGDCDLQDIVALKSRIEPFYPNALIHLAASPDVNDQLDNCWPSFHNTISCAVNAIRALPRTGSSLFIHIGSYKQYGRASMPFQEQGSVAPCTAYGLAKQTAEQFVRIYPSDNVHVICLRIGSVFGPGQHPRHLVPSIVRAILENRTAELMVADVLWDPVYIDDVIDSIILCLNSHEAFGKVINISGGRAYKPKEIVQVIARLMNKEISLTQLRTTFDALPLFGDISLASKILRWVPKISIEEGLLRTIKSLTGSGYNLHG